MNSKKNQKQTWGPFSLVVFCTFSILISGIFVSTAFSQDNGIDSLKKTGKAFDAMAKKVSPAVAFIKVEKIVEGQPVVNSSSPFGGQNPLGDDFLKHFFSSPNPRHLNSIIG